MGKVTPPRRDEPGLSPAPHGVWGEGGAARGARAPQRLQRLLGKRLVQHKTGRFSGDSNSRCGKETGDKSPATSWIHTPKKKEFDTA